MEGTLFSCRKECSEVHGKEGVTHVASSGTFSIQLSIEFIGSPSSFTVAMLAPQVDMISNGCKRYRQEAGQNLNFYVYERQETVFNPREVLQTPDALVTGFAAV